MIPSTLITLCLAEYSSRDDLHQIGKGSKIRHGLQWLFRAAVVALACYLDDCLLYAVPLAFLFSAVFRWRLNVLRGKDWRYVGPWSAIYDRGFYGMTYFLVGDGWPNKNTVWDSVARTYHNGFRYDGVISWGVRDRIHRAGTLAYIFEAVCFVVGTAWYIWAQYGRAA